MSGATVGKDKKSSSRTSAPKGAGRILMPQGGFRSLEGDVMAVVIPKTNEYTKADRCGLENTSREKKDHRVDKSKR